MTAAVLYARYSTTLQSAASVEDQFRTLRQRAEREGWTVVSEFADRAISGTVRDRPGLNACLAAIESSAATIILAEALDRISRDQEDIAAIHKRVRFAGGRMVTLSEGDIGTIHIGMGGTIAAIYVEQLAEKTRRGQVGSVLAGRVPGGLSYGYRAIRRFGPGGEPERGLREVDQDQAAIVRRIFTEYAEGRSPLAIATTLNQEGVASPRGGLWRANAIIGHRQRGNGILHNELYIGRIVYNRQTFRKDPDSRRRVSRPNDAADRVVNEVADLRIISEDLWTRVQERLATYADKPAHQARRPRRLLSGLMSCGCCGGNYIMVGPGRWGCTANKQTGTCTNTATISDREAQRRIWRALRDNLLAPEMIDAYLDEWRLLEAEARRTAMARRARAERRLAEIQAEDARMVEAIASGMPLEALRARAEALDAERTNLRTSLAAIPLPAPIPHPTLIENYRREIEELRMAATADATPEIREDARRFIQNLVDRIEITPRGPGERGTAMTIHGQLAALLTTNEKGPTETGEATCMLTMVAGAGFEPATFRL